jgi:hypothetical protein
MQEKNEILIKKINLFLGEEVVTSSAGTTTVNIDRTPFKNKVGLPLTRRRPKKGLLGQNIK